MEAQRKRGLIGRLFGHRGQDDVHVLVELRRIEEKRRGIVEATDQWLALLRDMEHAGESGEARYDAYYRAYLKSKEQQKRVDLELFNMRQGLTA